MLGPLSHTVHPLMCSTNQLRKKSFLRGMVCKTPGVYTLEFECALKSGKMYQAIEEEHFSNHLAHLNPSIIENV